MKEAGDMTHETEEYLYVSMPQKLNTAFISSYYNQRT